MEGGSYTTGVSLPYPSLPMSRFTPTPHLSLPRGYPRRSYPA